jgi:hypothetical protein
MGDDLHDKERFLEEALKPSSRACASPCLQSRSGKALADAYFYSDKGLGRA